jgi:hypothetical protein
VWKNVLGLKFVFSLSRSLLFAAFLVLTNKVLCDCDVCRIAFMPSYKVLIIFDCPTEVYETHSARLVTLSKFDSVFKGSLKKW